jgi:hypothetical protein
MVYKRHIVLFLILAACLVLALTGCASNTEPIETESDFTGFITDVQAGQAKDITGRISVESHADKIVSKYVITVNKDTAIFRQDGSNYNKAEFKELEARQWVKIWFTGPVLESWPMQATALQIVITGQTVE